MIDKLSWISIYPEALLLVMACVIALFDLRVNSPRRTATYVLTLATLAVVAVMQALYASGGFTIYGFGRMVVSDPMGNWLKCFATLAMMVTLVYGRPYAGDRDMLRGGEMFTLSLFALLGMFVMISGNNFLVIYLGLELLTLSSYALVALRRDNATATEAAMKYFLLGAYSSGFFVFGAAMLYGFSGTISFNGIVESMAANPGGNGLLIAGACLLFVGLLFKIGAVPFHQWTPDVYQGAPTPATAFMAAGVKIAAVGGLLRLCYVALGGLRWDWRPVMWAVAIATMLIGAIVALTQTDIKRMLAYSAIANAGFMLIGVIATNAAGLSGTMFYLLAYGFSTLGAFAIVSLVRDPAGEATKLSQWAGLGKTSPLVAGAMAIMLLAFAGIPLTSGFTSKFAVFEAGIQGGATPVVIVGVFASAIAAFFYVRVIVLMFFTDRAEDAPSVVVPSSLTAVAIGVAVAVTVILGVLPQSVLDLADKASTFIR